MVWTQEYDRSGVIVLVRVVLKRTVVGNVSHQRLFFSELPSSGRSQYTNYSFRGTPHSSCEPKRLPPSGKILGPPLCFIQPPARYSLLLNGILHSLQGNTVFIKETIPALKIWDLDGCSGKTAMVTMKVMERFLMAITGNSQRFTSVVEQTEIKTFLSSFLLIFHFFCWLTSQRNARWLSGQWLVWSGYIIIQGTGTTTINEMARILTTVAKWTPPFITVTIRVRDIHWKLKQTFRQAAGLWNENANCVKFLANSDTYIANISRIQLAGNTIFTFTKPRPLT